MVRVAMCWILVTACSGNAEPPRPERVVPHDAREEVGDPAAVDPRSELPRPPGRPAQPRASHPIDVILRSSPTGATVAVDGVQVGTTPTYWAGDANGRDHEFLFVRKGYAYARYRFVPVTSGVVHARLEPVAEDSDAGVPPEVIRLPDDPALGPAVHRAPPLDASAASPASPGSGAPPDAAPIDRDPRSPPGAGPEP